MQGVGLFVILCCLFFGQVYARFALGVCYYPEHWSSTQWESDIRGMTQLGLKYVRVGEFMWSVIEPEYMRFNWTTLDAVFTLADKYNIKVVLGTPTATPPKWLIDRYGGNGEDSRVLPFDVNGHPRKFGSRRHYSFSSDVYAHESQRIVLEMAKRYGKHVSLIGWQTDNEYGCHSTTRTFDNNALLQFRKWLAKKYNHDISKLNAEWGQAFWSAHYASFDAIDLPHLTVTDAFPAQWLDFYRFSSDQLSEYNRLQVKIIRQYSPDRFITHNFMGWFFEFDHYDLMETGLDFASWDSYPLGFTDMSTFFTPKEKGEYIRTGHPDLPAFHHDLFRGVSRVSKNNNFWVMEQQPGPVNWADYNPSPAAGMIRLWTWDAFARGADVVSYFRWRQVPYAQEQMHAGLHLPNDKPDVAFHEVAQVLKEIEAVKSHLRDDAPKEVAIVFDYPTEWIFKIQAQGKDFHYVKLVYMIYSQLRQDGQDVDIVRPGTDLSQYKLVIVPSLAHVNAAALKSFQDFVALGKGQLVFGPRTGSKTANLAISPNLPPGSLQPILPIAVTRVESFGSHSILEDITGFKGKYNYTTWREHVDVLNPEVEILAKYSNDNKGSVYSYKKVEYFGFYPEREFITDYLSHVYQKSELVKNSLPRNVRISRMYGLVFCFNYNAKDIQTPAGSAAIFIVGGRTTPGYGLSIWKE
jgi:beta-galactosidase